MCYQASLNQSEEDIKRYLNRPPIESNILNPYYLNDGFTHSNVYIIPMDDPKHWYSASWGLVPSYSNPEEFYKDARYNTLNARDDKVFDSRLYSKPIRAGRCLIFADGFFEPHHIGKESQPYFCYLQESKSYKEREIFTFAGIYTSAGEGDYYTSLITVNANPLFEKIHNNAKRMPLVLDRKYEEDWIANGQSESVIKDIMKEGFTTKPFTAHPVLNYRLKKNWDIKNTEQVIKPVDALDIEMKL